MNQERRTKELEQENTKLTKLVAQLSWDKAILSAIIQEIAAGKLPIKLNGDKA
jgi:hypothetical protein